MFDVKKVDEKKTDKMGTIGEKIVADFLTNKYNAEVVISKDKYDSVKDMTVNGQSCEVKTQVPWITENAFSVKRNQLKKCNNAEVLIFVEIPYSNKYGKNDTINIWLSKKEDRKPFHKRPKDYKISGREMVGYSKRDMKKLHSIDDPVQCRQLVELSNSQL